MSPLEDTDRLAQAGRIERIALDQRLHLPGVIVAQSETGEVRYLLGDGLGSIRQAVDDTGAVVGYNEYDPYGNIIVMNDPDENGYDEINPFRFSTKWLDTELADDEQTGAIGESGLYYYGYRYYSPTLGRWTSEDPIEETGASTVNFAWCKQRRRQPV